MLVADGRMPIWRRDTATIAVGHVGIRHAQLNDMSVESAQWCLDCSTPLLSRQIDVLC